MVVQLRRMAFINKNIAQDGLTFAPPPPLSLQVVRQPPFYFIFGVYIY